LFAESEYEECLALLRLGRQRYPQDFWIHFALGYILQIKRREKRTAVELEEAIGCYRAALALRPETYAVHINLGQALRDQGQLDAAIAACHEAIRLKKDHPYAHYNLGNARYARRQWDQAIAAYQEAIRLKKDFPEAHYNLGLALARNGQLDAAIAAFQEAIRLKPDHAGAHVGLATALLGKGRLDDAIEEYQEAIRLNKDVSDFHYNLGLALAAKGRHDLAADEWREAIRLNPDHAEAHCNLGIALRMVGRLDEAIAECRYAITLKKDLAEAHYSLGQFLAEKGQFHEALEEARRGHELGSRLPNWKNPSAQLVRQRERLVELDDKLPAILQGKTRPANPEERLEYARLCCYKRLHGAAARFFDEAFAAEPKLADDLGASHRYNAACAAALAGCGQGKDVDKLDPVERVRLRRQALDWLKADLEAWRRLLGREPDKLRPILAKNMRHWLADADFAGMRGPAAIAKLPEVERQAWQKLWADVAATLDRAQVKPTPDKQ
jgi:tetratricopeptide (TPR) repeat protein